MKKCVRITVSSIRDPDTFLACLKKDAEMGGVEGVVEVIVPDTVEITIYGTKDGVDEFVNMVDGCLIKHNLSKRDHASLALEPHFKEEDYRGVVRFIKKGGGHR